MRGRNVTVRVSDYYGVDVRGRRELGAAASIEQNRADERLLAEWQERVKQNELRRATRKRAQAVTPNFLRRQAI